MVQQDISDNILLKKQVGDEADLWQKMMKETKQKRFAGPFVKIPFDNFVQSPVGLVPKAGNQTRLIFHLSYDFKKSGFKSINHYILREKCSVKHNDIDHAVKNYLRLIKENPGCELWMGISDLKSAFCMVPLVSKWWPYLTMEVRNPETKQWMFFFDKCLPFGAAISCAIFQ